MTLYMTHPTILILLGGRMQEKYLMLSERRKSEILNFLPSDSDVSRLADYFQNFSDFTRLKIISCLSICDMCVGDISTLLGVNQTTVSHQLKILKDQGLVNYRRDGKVLLYSLTERSVNDVMMYAVEYL